MPDNSNNKILLTMPDLKVIKMRTRLILFSDFPELEGESDLTEKVDSKILE